jgi:hypothetical protein
MTGEKPAPLRAVKEEHERVSDLIANPSYCLVAGARNHLQANRSLEFSFDITT